MSSSNYMQLFFSLTCSKRESYSELTELSIIYKTKNPKKKKLPV